MLYWCVVRKVLNKHSLKNNHTAPNNDQQLREYRNIELTYGFALESTTEWMTDQLATEWQHTAARKQMAEICNQQPDGSELQPATKWQQATASDRMAANFSQWLNGSELRRVTEFQQAGSNGRRAFTWSQRQIGGEIIHLLPNRKKKWPVTRRSELEPIAKRKQPMISKPTAPRYTQQVSGSKLQSATNGRKIFQTLNLWFIHDQFMFLWTYVYHVFIIYFNRMKWWNREQYDVVD